MHASIWLVLFWVDSRTNSHNRTFKTLRHASAPNPFRFRFTLHLHWIHSVYLFYSSFCLRWHPSEFSVAFHVCWLCGCCCCCMRHNLNVIYGHSALQINKINVKRNCFTLSRRIPVSSIKFAKANRKFHNVQHFEWGRSRQLKFPLNSYWEKKKRTQWILKHDKRDQHSISYYAVCVLMRTLLQRAKYVAIMQSDCITCVCLCVCMHIIWLFSLHFSCVRYVVLCARCAFDSIPFHFILDCVSVCISSLLFCCKWLLLHRIGGSVVFVKHTMPFRIECKAMQCAKWALMRSKETANVMEMKHSGT